MARILVVDDEEPFRMMLEQMLNQAGHQTEAAADGRIALDLYLRSPFDLVVTDLLMPGIEGIELIGTLRKLNPDVKIIAISGGGRRDPDINLKMANRLGAQLTLTKPFLLEEFLDAVALELL